jgi:hypothetical protein
MSKDKVHDKAIIELLKEYKDKAGGYDIFISNLVDSYLQDSIGGLMLLVKSGSKEALSLDNFSPEVTSKLNEKVFEALFKNRDFSNSLYKKSYEGLKALGDEGKSYGDLLTEIYEDVDYLNEIFVRLVEEREGVVITSAKQLQEITKITHLDSWDIKTGGYVTPETEEEAKENANKQTEDIFIEAMSYRYTKALRDIIEAGGKYSDLLKVKPSYFNLPEIWRQKENQYYSILWTLIDAFLIMETSAISPDLRAIAKEIEAPYSVLMDANKLC